MVIEFDRNDLLKWIENARQINKMETIMAPVRYYDVLGTVTDYTNSGSGFSSRRYAGMWIKRITYSHA